MRKRMDQEFESLPMVDGAILVNEGISGPESRPQFFPSDYLSRGFNCVRRGMRSHRTFRYKSKAHVRTGLVAPES
jgi:hypothetical protein